MIFIKKILSVFLFFIVAVTATGEQTKRESSHRALAASVNRGTWMARRLMSEEFMQKVGIEGDQAKKIKEELEKIEQQSAQLDKEINRAAMHQAEIAKKVLSEPNASVDEIMKIIDHIGACRIEQAKLATRRLVVIRDNLTAEQRKKVSDFLSEERKKMHETRERNATTNRSSVVKTKSEQ